MNNEHAPLEHLQEQEYSRLVNAGHVYVDYTGGGQCPESVLQKIHEQLISTTFGNPHSHNPTAAHTTDLVEDVRDMLLKQYNGEGYTLVFTPNASGALKIVGECYPWSADTVLILSRDNHNSMLGMREYAARAGATVEYWELDDELRLEDNLEELLQQHDGKQCIVGFPAQSNFSGVIHPQKYIDIAHKHGAEVVFDTAAYLPTHELDLQKHKPDAICVSFYKVLGYPTGIGALIVRNELLAKLEKQWFAGGTVRGVSLESHVLEDGHERFENGTINYAGIPALKFVYEFIDSIGGVATIGDHVETLTKRALEGIARMEHVDIYGPKTMNMHGGTIALNIIQKDGTPLHYEEVEKLAFKQHISLRGGCFCNPGSGSRAFALDTEQMHDYLEKLKCASKCEVGVPGAVRISFGIANTMADVEKSLDFIRSLAPAA